jgi:glycolate oxidase FAD binding subunit
MTILEPASEAEAEAMVIEARAARRPLVIQGGGTRAGLGRPVEAEDGLSSAGLRGVTLYEPAELVIAARAGTPLQTLEAILSSQGQMLPFEPMDHRSLYGTTGAPTVGGLVATNASGPRRIAAGAVRDHLIGVRLVNGLGEAVKSGGRVMKNVTGLDLVKLVCGAHGTLGFLTEVTFKVLPRPEVAATLVWPGLDDARGVAALGRAFASPFEPTGGAHLPGWGGAPARTLVRLEGFGVSVDYRAGRLAEVLADCGAPERIEAPVATALWTEIRDGATLRADADHAVWRLSVPPQRAPEVVFRARTVAIDHYYDWSGGLVWIATEASGDAGAAPIRAALAPCGGHATLLRAPAAVRAAVPVFEPLDPAVRTLTAGIKRSFDPDGLFNPGRMYRAM